MTTPEQLAASIAFLAPGPDPPEIALILGSGLGDFANTILQPRVFDTSAIPHYPISSVEGHKGRIVFGLLGGRNLVVFQGRVHYYETGDIEAILYPVQIAHALGVQFLVVTNAAGGVSRGLSAGDLMGITDQLNLTGKPYRVAPGSTAHLPFYDSALLEEMKKTAGRLGIPLKSGVYAGDTGPSYETAAEVDMIHRLGGDAVGMSTIFETALAASLGIRVAGISCVTNPGTGISPEKLSHAEVTEVANRVKKTFTALLTEFVGSLP